MSCSSGAFVDHAPVTQISEISVSFLEIQAPLGAEWEMKTEIFDISCNLL
jgi:hypothetical protein